MAPAGIRGGSGRRSCGLFRIRRQGTLLVSFEERKVFPHSATRAIVTVLTRRKRTCFSISPVGLSRVSGREGTGPWIDGRVSVFRIIQVLIHHQPRVKVTRAIWASTRVFISGAGAGGEGAAARGRSGINRVINAGRPSSCSPCNVSGRREAGVSKTGKGGLGVLVGRHECSKDLGNGLRTTKGRRPRSEGWDGVWKQKLFWGRRVEEGGRGIISPLLYK